MRTDENVCTRERERDDGAIGGERENEHTEPGTMATSFNYKVR